MNTEQHIQELNELVSSTKRTNELSNSILKRVDERLKELKVKEDGWQKMETKMEENENKKRGKIVFDVGGKKFATSKDTLLKQTDTYFSALLRSDNFKPDEDGSYFIDRNPKYFGIILDFLRTGKLSIKDLNSDQIATLRADLGYYQINAINQLCQSSIINGEQKLLIEKWAGKTFGKLLWRASKHGFAVSQFHCRCDGKGTTVTLIKSAQGWIFGGYAAVPWNSAGSYYGSGNCFIFTISNPNNIPPTKYDFLANNYVYGNASYGPTFGGGHDVYVADQSNVNANSYTNFQHSYHDTTGKGNNTFTGAKAYTTSDVEVYEMK